MKLTSGQKDGLTLMLAFGNVLSNQLKDRKDNSPEQQFIFSTFRHKFETTIRDVGSIDVDVDVDKIKVSIKLFFDFMNDWADNLPSYPKEFTTSNNSNYHVLSSIFHGFEKALTKIHKENKKQEKIKAEEGSNLVGEITLEDEFEEHLNDLKQNIRINKAAND